MASELVENLLWKVAHDAFKFAMMDKEELRLSRLDDSGKPRPKLAWAEYSDEELIAWLKREVKELYDAIESGDREAISSELCDVGNFCEFFWVRINFLPIVPEGFDIKKK